MFCLWWTVWPRDATLARQRVLSSSEVRASDLEHGGSWVRIPSGAQTFSVSSYGWFFTSPFISFIILISVANKVMKKTFMDRNSLNRYFIIVIIIFQRNDGDCETSLSLKCQSLHSYNLLPSIWGIKGIERQLGSTNLYLNRLQIRINLTKT